MKIGDLVAGNDAAVGRELHAFATRLYPLCRSITGDGLRQTLRIVGENLPLELHEVPSGTQVLDWTVPHEWNVREAWVKDATGRKVMDFHDHNLRLMSYSVPVRRTLSLDELKPHLFSLPNQPDLIPYRTSYYQENWGFCVRHTELEQLAPGNYEVCIDSTLAPGSLTYGEVVLPGSSDEEILLSTHCCHPSLANDNLSGIAIAARLACELGRIERRFTYRFLFLPVTIGAITWLARNEPAASRVRHGLVLSCLGDSGGFTYKRSRRGDADIDRAMEYVLRSSEAKHEVVDFSPYGYDERQFCSPGFNLPVGCFMRSPNGRFPEYHTSADNLDFIRPEALAGSFATLLRTFEVLEANRRFLNLHPKGEPQLGKRGLHTSPSNPALPLLWVLNFSDGNHDLLHIAQRSGLPFADLARAADRLTEHQLLRVLN